MKKSSSGLMSILRISLQPICIEYSFAVTCMHGHFKQVYVMSLAGHCVNYTCNGQWRWRRVVLMFMFVCQTILCIFVGDDLDFCLLYIMYCAFGKIRGQFKLDVLVDTTIVITTLTHLTGIAITYGVIVYCKVGQCAYSPL